VASWHRGIVALLPFISFLDHNSDAILMHAHGPLQKGSGPEPEPVCLKNTLKEAFGAQLPSFKQVSSVNFGQTHGICFLPLSICSNPK